MMDTAQAILSRIDDLRVTLGDRIGDLTRAIDRQNGRVTKLEDTRATQEDVEGVTERVDLLEPRVRSLEDDRLKLVTLVSLTTTFFTLWGDRLIRWLFGG